MTEPYDARTGKPDPTLDPATIGESRLDAEDADGGAVVDQPVFQEPGADAAGG